jgi:hypothetical protein
MRTSDEHTKLARVALDFWPDLDSAFDLNVAKARVSLPADLRSQLQPHIEQLTKQARKVYSPSSATPPAKAGEQQSGPTTASQTAEETAKYSSRAASAQSSVASPKLAHIGRAIDAAASNAGEEAALKRIRKALKAQNPDTATEIGW